MKELTAGQHQAMEMVRGLLRHPEPFSFGILSGYAGTGKTFLISEIAKEFGIPVIVAPTGKAATRVRELTGIDAATCHRWMYDVKEDNTTGELISIRKASGLIARTANCLVIVDESSMLSKQMWEDIEYTARAVGCRVLLIGDPFQLPPVTKPGDPVFSVFDLETIYSAKLTEICRQAEGNPIIQLSMALRKGSIQAMDAINDAKHVSFDKLPKTFAETNTTQALIVHRNTTRHELNRLIREAHKYGRELEPGEPLLVIKNNYSLDRFNGEVLNFECWDHAPGGAIAVRDRYKQLSAYVSYGTAKVGNQTVTISPDEICGATFGLGEKTIERAAKGYVMTTFGMSKSEAPPHLNCNLGYAITCHRAQGSQWSTVYVVVEPSLRDKFGYEWRRWVYTAATRSEENLFFTFL